jgi:hypothetical protein
MAFGAIPPDHFRPIGADTTLRRTMVLDALDTVAVRWHH